LIKITGFSAGPPKTAALTSAQPATRTADKMMR
jgi:hypothetical protein